MLGVGIAMGLMKQGAMMTVAGTLLTALAWPATLLAATDFIDSKWSIAVDRFFSTLTIVVKCEELVSWTLFEVFILVFQLLLLLHLM